MKTGVKREKRSKGKKVETCNHFFLYDKYLRSDVVKDTRSTISTQAIKLYWDTRVSYEKLY